jgi:putative endonuclease
MYQVYIIFSESSDRYYTGSAEHAESRLKQHNGGYNRSTKSGIPWKTVKVITVENRKVALQLELKIKKRGAKRFLDDLEE